MKRRKQHRAWLVAALTSRRVSNLDKLTNCVPLDKSQISVILVASSASIFNLSAVNSCVYFLMENDGEESYAGTTLLVAPAARSMCVQSYGL